MASDFITLRMSSASSSLSARDTVPSESRRDGIHLPAEILSAIISLVQFQEDPQGTLHSCCLISRSWYSVAVTQLYKSPIFTGTKYHLFIRTICPSKIVYEMKSPLSEYIQTLDLSAWRDDVREDVTERLLGKVRGRLEVFIAPRAFFSWVYLYTWMETKRSNF
jgi:hypothetical protein